MYLLIDGATRVESESGAFRLDSALETRLRLASVVDLSWRSLRGSDDKQAQVKLEGLGAALDQCASSIGAPR